MPYDIYVSVIGIGIDRYGNNKSVSAYMKKRYQMNKLSGRRAGGGSDIEIGHSFHISYYSQMRLSFTEVDYMQWKIQDFPVLDWKD